MFFLMLIVGTVLVLANWIRIVTWYTEKRMAYRHTVTRAKIELLKTLHDLDLL